MIDESCYLGATEGDPEQRQHVLIESLGKGDTMADLGRVVQQLKKERDQTAKTLAQLDAALSALNGASSGQPRRSRSRLSAAARAKIAAAQRARWTKVRADNKGNGSHKQSVVAAPKKKRAMTAAARKKIAAAQRARWEKLKSSQKKVA